jgi:hypothetical protein
MRRGRIAVYVPRGAVTVVLLVLLAAPAAFAQEEKPKQPRDAPRTDSPMVTKGPCFDTAAASMPDGPGHDHANLAQHQFSCGFRQVAHLPLTAELAARPDVMLGESDVKNDIAAVAVAYPEAGALFFDVKDPAHPRFLSWYRGGDCDTVVLDTDCGAYISLSDDGKVAFLSIQALSPLGNGGFHGTLPTTVPGVQVIDLDNPAAPLLVQFLPIAGVNGVHTARYHEITSGPMAGEYLFMTANSVGVQIARITRSGGLAHLALVNVIQIDEVHDTFIQEDPIDHTTYLYVAAGNTSGFYVYDVLNPLSPRLVAEWDLQPECHTGWYAHTIDATIRGRKRYVTMPTEGFYLGSGEGEPCGDYLGNGDRPGVMWIVDASDLSKLGPANATDGNNPPDPALGAASQNALVATWHNAANAASGDLQFSPHNQEIHGDRIYLSAYHGGITVLDAHGAFEGRHERPYEVAVATPASSKRAIYKPPTQPVNGYYISAFFASPADFWDLNYYKGFVLAYDEHGGMYSLQEDPTANTTCADDVRPKVRLTSVRLTGRRVRVAGRATDRGCRGAAGALAHVDVAVGRRVGKRCAFLLTRGRFAKPVSCKQPITHTAKGRSKFTVALRGRLPRGRYLVVAQAVDQAENSSAMSRRTVRLR